MNARMEMARLLDIKEKHDRADWRSDPERLEAQRRWLVEAVELLLRAQLGLVPSSST